MVNEPLDVPTALRARGLRMTPQRQLILEVINSLSGHISADAVHRSVIERFPNVNISTVYRTLEVLQELGVVNHTHFHDGIAQYHLASEGVHQHIVCRECGSEKELDVRVVEPLANTLREDYGFEADIAHFAIVGLCAGCHAREAQNQPHSHGSGAQGEPHTHAVAYALRRLGGVGVALTGFICPCHALTGAVIALSLVVSGSAPAVSPALQDGVHSVYLPAAVLTSAWLLRPKVRTST